MLHTLNAAAASALAIAGLGLTSVLGPVSAQALPAQPPASPSASCPGAGVHYLPDPKNSNAYFVCQDGVQTQHRACPPIAKLMFTDPPTCSPQSNHHMA